MLTARLELLPGGEEQVEPEPEVTIQPHWQLKIVNSHAESAINLHALIGTFYFLMPWI